MTEGLVYSDVTAAAARISGLVMRTPIFSSAAINDIAGQEIYKIDESDLLVALK